MSVGTPVAVVDYESSGTSTSHNKAIASTAAAGSLCVVVGNISNVTNAMTLTDSQGNTWTAAAGGPFATGGAAGNTGRLQVWTSVLATTMTAATDSLTLATTPSAVRCNFIAFTLASADTGSPIRVAAAASNEGGTASTAWATPSVTAAAGDLILLLGMLGGATASFASPPAGFTDYLKVADTRALDVLYKQSAGETIAASGTLAGSNPWIGASMVIAGVASSATVTFPQSVTIHP